MESESSNYGCLAVPLVTFHMTQCALPALHKMGPQTLIIVSKTKQNFSPYLPQSSLGTLIELGQLKIQKATMSDTTPGQSLLPSPNSYDCWLSSKIQKTNELKNTHHL